MSLELIGYDSSGPTATNSPSFEMTPVHQASFDPTVSEQLSLEDIDAFPLIRFDPRAANQCPSYEHIDKTVPAATLGQELDTRALELDPLNFTDELWDEFIQDGMWTEYFNQLVAPAEYSTDSAQDFSQPPVEGDTRMTDLTESDNNVSQRSKEQHDHVRPAWTNRVIELERDKTRLVAGHFCGRDSLRRDLGKAKELDAFL